MKKLNSFLDNLVSVVGIIGALVLAVTSKSAVFGFAILIVIVILSLALATSIAKIADLEEQMEATTRAIEELKVKLEDEEEE